jgi:hypothetical protein
MNRGEIMKNLLLISLIFYLLSCNLDLANVRGLVDNREGACDQFNFEISLFTTIGTLKESASIPKGIAIGISYASGLGQGTKFSIAGDCIIGQQSVKLTGSYYHPERYVSWEIKITDRSNPRLVPPFLTVVIAKPRPTRCSRD